MYHSDVRLYYFNNWYYSNITACRKMIRGWKTCRNWVGLEETWEEDCKAHTTSIYFTLNWKIKPKLAVAAGTISLISLQARHAKFFRPRSAISFKFIDEKFFISLHFQFQSLWPSISHFRFRPHQFNEAQGRIFSFLPPRQQPLHSKTTLSQPLQTWNSCILTSKWKKRREEEEKAGKNWRNSSDVERPRSQE